MASLGPSGSAQLRRPSSLAANSISILRIKPFSSHRTAQRQQLVKLRAAEPEASPATASAATEETDHAFSYSGAKKNNEYSASDVEAALKYYLEGEGQQSDYDKDHVVNSAGTEDASFFDDIDNVDGYENDEYATAGIAEAAPKQKRRNQETSDDRVEEGDDFDKAKEAGASQQLEEEAIMRAQLEEMESDSAQDADFDDSPAEGGDTAVWSWLADYDNMSDVPSDSLSMSASVARMPSTPTEGEVLGSLSRGIAAGEELDPAARDYLEFLAEDVALEQELALLDENNDDELPESAPEAADDDARIAQLLAEDLGELELNPQLLEGDDEEDEETLANLMAGEPLDDDAFEAYLAQLRDVPNAENEQGGMDEELLSTLQTDAEGAVPEEIEDDGMDNEEADIEALLASAPGVAAGDAGEEADELLATFASNDDEDDAPEDEDDVEAYSRDLQALMAEEGGWTEETAPTEQQLETFEAYVTTAEDYLAVEEERREYLSNAVARGELPIDVLEEEMADPVDNEVELYNDMLEDLEDTGPDYTLDNSEDDGITWQERIIELTRVTKVTKGGKVMGFRCTAVIGNSAGLVGVGCDSGREIAIAVKRALVDAKKNIVMVPLVGPGTIPHVVEAKYKAARCLVRPASDGTGVIAGGSIRSVLELAGVQNCLAKRLGCRSLLTNARATVKALSMLRTLGEVSEARGVPYEQLLVPSRK